MFRRGVAALRRHMSENQVLSAGVWIGGLSGALGSAYLVVDQAFDFAGRYLYSSLVIRSKEDAFVWVNDWVTEHADTFITSSRQQIRVSRQQQRPYVFDGDGCDDFVGEVYFEPGVGAHIFFFEGKPIFLQREASDTIVTGYSRQPYTPEVLRLWSFGGGDTLRRFLSTCRRDAVGKTSGKLHLYIPSHDVWRRISGAKSRSKDTLILQENLLESVLDDARAFLSSRKRYESLGVPYRRGYLLYGPPGNGKSSLVATMAGELKLGVCTLSLNSKDLDDVTLAALLRESPEESILLLEDVDSVFAHRAAADHDARVTFSGLLNALDGVASQEGCLLVMTTNHIDKLDPALLRAGRCDVKAELGNATPGQAAALLKKFYPSATEEEQRRFARVTKSHAASMADLQAHLLNHADPSSCLETLPDFTAQLQATTLAWRPDAVEREPIHSFVRKLGCKSLLWPLYAAGVRWAHEIPAVDVVDSPVLRSRLEDYVQSSVAKRLVSTVDVTSLVASRFGPPVSQKDDNLVSRLSETLSGKVVHEAAAEWLSQQPTIQRAVSSAPDFVKDCYPVPDQSWQGRLNWDICRGLCDANDLDPDAICPTALSLLEDVNANTASHYKDLLLTLAA